MLSASLIARICPGMPRHSFRGSCPRGLCPLRRRTQIVIARAENRRPQGLPVRRGFEGRDQALAVQGIWRRLHTRDAARRADGVERRGLRGLLQLRRRASGRTTPRRTSRGGRMTVLRTARKVRDTRITLAHGGGGKAMHDLIEDVFVTTFDDAALHPLEDQARLHLAELVARGDRPAFTTDSYVENVGNLVRPALFDLSEGG